MANDYSADNLLSFLEHASERGLMPVATARALAVACRNVFAVLTDAEKADVRALNVDEAIKRFTNKRAREFNPSSLREYGQRVHRAVKLFLAWRGDPAGFSVKTRNTNAGRKRDTLSAVRSRPVPPRGTPPEDAVPSHADAYNRMTVPVRPGQFVSITGIPDDLSKAEAERLCAFIRLLAVD